jgi:hypothetical protein
LYSYSFFFVFSLAIVEGQSDGDERLHMGESTASLTDSCARGPDLLLGPTVSRPALIVYSTSR